LEDRADAQRQLAEDRAAAKRDAKNHTDYVNRLNAAGAAYNKATAAISAEVKAATDKRRASEMQYNADNRAAAAARSRAAAETRVYNSTAGLRSMLGQLSKQWDTLSASLDTARTKLIGLREDRSSMISQLGGSIASFDSGILGHADQRKTFADVLRGAQYNQKQVQGFSANLAQLKNLGLSADLIQQIASAGVAGGAGTASALVGASKAEIAQLNKTVQQTNAYGTAGATVAASAIYDPQIKAQTAIYTGLTKLLSGVGSIESQIAHALNTMNITMKIDPQGIARLTAVGNAQLKRRA
jgi:hypothetical protein